MAQMAWTTWQRQVRFFWKFEVDAFACSLPRTDRTGFVLRWAGKAPRNLFEAAFTVKRGPLRDGESRLTVRADFL